ncbi:hypothetical protein PoB_006682400 [Plakobranchus ocellatus]|uniref:Uncharacterized protein n=1 Tax=Plakobranchus ocellatus TaxID=259542 RepID=A0AAV4D846_9GAST|nr:hypothetical protein PoB_006682400 [Plakobranchus ocellatus]
MRDEKAKPSLKSPHFLLIWDNPPWRPKALYHQSTVQTYGPVFDFLYTVSPQQGDLRLSGPSLDQDAGGGTRTRYIWVSADLRANLKPKPSYR